MAVDKTEPPIKVIITVAGLSLGILVTMRVFFVSYFNSAYDTRARANIDQALHGSSYIWTAARVHTEEERRLSRLQASMASVAQGQRAGAISPTASTDIAALTGWTLMPREVPRPPPPPAPVAPPVVAPDLGALGTNAGGPMGVAPAAPAAAAPAAAAPAPVAPAPVVPAMPVAPAAVAPHAPGAH
jgi:hypothetical protein